MGIEGDEEVAEGAGGPLFGALPQLGSAEQTKILRILSQFSVF